MVAADLLRSRILKVKDVFDLCNQVHVHGFEFKERLSTMSLYVKGMCP